jgi:hypothetical protein
MLLPVLLSQFLELLLATSLMVLSQEEMKGTSLESPEGVVNGS